MFDRQSLHIALLLWGFIFSLIAAVCMFMSKNFDKKKRKIMLYMLLACAILLLSDAFAWGYRGGEGELGRYMVWLSNFLVFFFSDVILALYHGYVCCVLFQENEDAIREVKTRRKIRAVYVIAAVAMALVVLNQFTGFYYYFDAQNFYHRNSGYFISLLLPLMGMLIDLDLILQYHKYVSRRVAVSLISYIILPYVAAIAQIFYYGISMINIAISISMILMFIEAMIEQAQKIAKQERMLAEQERMLASQERQLTENKIATMMSQIRPHFIYNTLGSIEQLCELDPKMAAEMVHNFSKYLRGNFSEMDNIAPVPLSKEIEHCRYYVSIEKVRFPDMEIIFDIQSEHFQLPALTIQPLIENAIKHGLMKLPSGGTVKVSTYETQDDYCVSVEDNGAGFDVEHFEEDKKHVGLRNIRERLKAVCDGTLTVESAPGKGTKVVVQIPKMKKAKEKKGGEVK